MEAHGLAEPPAGVLAGESVPRENEEHDMVTTQEEALAGLLKAHPAYTGRSNAELREIARSKLEE